MYCCRQKLSIVRNVNRLIQHNVAMFSTTELRARIGYCSVPHPSNVDQGGEDAFFISNTKIGIAGVGGGWGWRNVMYQRNLKNITTKPTSFGVANGVGSSEKRGNLSGVFSNALMASCCEVATYNKTLFSPLGIISGGYKSVKPLMGCSTACVTTIDKNKIKCYNVGDTGFLMIRDGRVLHRTIEQIHAFKTPYQLGADSPDRPSDGTTFETNAKAGDFLVLATDGILDNLYDEEIVEQITDCIEDDVEWTQEALHTIARDIVSEAFQVAQDPRKKTPYCRSAKKFGYQYDGGKMDDMTILVAHLD